MYFEFPKFACFLLKINCNICEVILCIDYWYYSKFLEPYIFYIWKKFRSSWFRSSWQLYRYHGHQDSMREVWRREELTYELEGRGSGSGWRHSVAWHCSCQSAENATLLDAGNAGCFLFWLCGLRVKRCWNQRVRGCCKKELNSLQHNAILLGILPGVLTRILARKYFRKISTFWTVTLWRWVNSSWCFDAFYWLDLQGRVLQ